MAKTDTEVTTEASKKDETSVKPFIIKEALAGIIALLDKAVKAKDTRLMMGRLLRQTAVARRHLRSEDLTWFIKTYLLESVPAHGYLLQIVDQAGAESTSMDEDQAGDGVAAPRTTMPSSGSLPEVELYCYLLVSMYLLDKKHLSLGLATTSHAVGRLRDFNRRTLDVIAARIYFYYSWAHEQAGQLEDVRSVLLAAHRTAVLRHDSVGLETLLVLLLRNFLAANLYDQAEKLRSKAQVPDAWRVPGQYARYLYYLGRIRAVQLEYSSAKDCLAQATRRAPASAAGFRIACYKWLILVRLLLGEVPERAELVTPDMRGPLAPYLALTTAVRTGDLDAFGAVVAAHSAVFDADKAGRLITRLHHNVLRTGLHRINLAYSRISLQDVADKLHLASAEDAEFIVAKAIRDGGIDAVLDHSTGVLTSHEVLDVYSTREPQAAFHARIAFCLDVHNEAVRAMRFDGGAGGKGLTGESDDERRERLAQEQELAAAMADDDEDDAAL